MATGIKVYLKSEFGGSIDGRVVLKMGSTILAQDSAAGTAYFTGLTPGAWTLSGKTYSNLRTGGPKTVVAQQGKVTTATLILRPSAARQRISRRLQSISGVEDTVWVEVAEAKAQELVESHGGKQGDQLQIVEPASSDLPLPSIENQTSRQLFQAPDGFKILLITDDAELEYFFVLSGTERAKSGIGAWKAIAAGAAIVGGTLFLLFGVGKQK